jgi:hypothetical protein
MDSTERYEGPEGSGSYAATMDFLTAFSGQCAVPLLDTRPIISDAVMRAGGSDDVHIPGDGHFTPRGNRMMAQALLDFLEKNSLL